MQEEAYQLPQIDSRLRKNILRMPEAVFAVYPFTPQQAISDAIIKASYSR